MLAGVGSDTVITGGTYNSNNVSGLITVLLNGTLEDGNNIIFGDFGKIFYDDQNRVIRAETIDPNIGDDDLISL